MTEIKIRPSSYMAIPGIERLVGKPRLYADMIEFTLPQGSQSLGHTTVSLSQILREVCTHEGVSTDRVTASNKEREFVIVRQLYCWIGYKYTDSSLNRIGAEINRDHATVLYSTKAINNLCEVDQGLLDRRTRLDSYLQQRFGPMLKISTRYRY